MIYGNVSPGWVGEDNQSFSTYRLLYIKKPKWQYYVSQIPPPTMNIDVTKEW